MKNKRLNLIQKLFTRKTIGKVTEKREAYIELGTKPVTLYTITKREKVYDCAIIGHQHTPIIGDIVRVYPMELNQNFAKESTKNGERLWEKIELIEFV